jgi:hypothetical protein
LSSAISGWYKPKSFHGGLSGRCGRRCRYRWPDKLKLVWHDLAVRHQFRDPGGGAQKASGVRRPLYSAAGVSRISAINADVHGRLLRWLYGLFLQQRKVPGILQSILLRYIEQVSNTVSHLEKRMRIGICLSSGSGSIDTEFGLWSPKQSCQNDRLASELEVQIILNHKHRS